MNRVRQCGYRSFSAAPGSDSFRAIGDVPSSTSAAPPPLTGRENIAALPKDSVAAERIGTLSFASDSCGALPSL